MEGLRVRDFCVLGNVAEQKTQFSCTRVLQDCPASCDWQSIRVGVKLRVGVDMFWLGLAGDGRYRFCRGYRERRRLGATVQPVVLVSLP